MNIAALYTLYNPEINQLTQSVDKIKGKVETIYLVDNSPKSVEDELSLLLTNNIRYINCGGNTGIADALNKGCRFAIKDGYKWILILDQDSILPENWFDEYEKYFAVHDKSKIGAILPSFYLCPKSNRLIGGKDEEVDDYMTSGSLINLDAYAALGNSGFRKELFIDMVDTAYGFDLIKNGYHIFRIGKVVLHHNIGNAKQISIFGNHVGYITHHNYIRRYYITRNLLWVSKHYGKEFKAYSNPNFRILKSICRIILFEKDKIRKLKSVLDGFVDFKKNKLGKYEKINL